MIEYVKKQSLIGDLFTKYPFLLNLSINHIFQSKLINEYMGYELVKYQSRFNSRDINIILNEAEKRGDLLYKASEKYK